MNGELIDPKDFVSFFDWWTILVIVLAAAGVYGWGKAAFKITTKTAMYLAPAIVYLFVRGEIPNQELHELVALGVILFYGTIVIWFFFIKKPKP